MGMQVFLSQKCAGHRYRLLLVLVLVWVTVLARTTHALRQPGGVCQGLACSMAVTALFLASPTSSRYSTPPDTSKTPQCTLVAGA